jgi:Zn finger protein HypA/HybF involved in hydrogenase expression
MPCYRCDRVQTDPARGASPWARGVIDRAQILICPECQAKDPDWVSDLVACPRCGSTRLSIVMGSIVCRGCNNDF